jgi:hypothetical protein
VLYASGEPAGAVAEAFASFSRWGDFLLEHPRGARRVLIAIDVPDELTLLDLDDARALVRRRLRPSEVVTRDRPTTQAWARRIWEEAQWAGVRWVVVPRPALDHARALGHEGRERRCPRAAVGDAQCRGRSLRGDAAHLVVTPAVVR